MIPETSQCRIIFSADLNDQETLFGGTAMKWMDEVAYITANRYAKKKMITVSVEKIQFLIPIKLGSVINIIGKVTKVKTFKIEIQVDIYLEDLITGQQKIAIKGLFIFAAVNEKNKPVPIQDYP